jgi:hypothetical protein
VLFQVLQRIEVRYWGDGGQNAFLMNNVLSFCDSDVDLRCPEVEMAQFFGRMFDLFSGDADAPGANDVGGGSDGDSDASGLMALGRRQQSVERTLEGVKGVL